MSFIRFVFLLQKFICKLGLARNYVDLLLRKMEKFYSFIITFWILFLFYFNRKCYSLQVNYSDNDGLSTEDSNSTKVLLKEGTHLFYNSSLIFDENLVNEYLNSFEHLNISNLLSNSYRKAQIIQLSFEFPFYGYSIRNITLSTGGFVYTGEYAHPYLASTQYIAPLMANFDPSISNDSFVRYSDNGTALTVVWENVSLQDNPNIGTFTFSTTLFNTGDIVFKYYSIPIQMKAINDDKHPVKIGLSDAYMMDKKIFFARRKTIYEYHSVHFDFENIKNSTTIYLTALPTCLKFKDNSSCLTESSNLNCVWCSTLNKCSTGVDRNRQLWIESGCGNT